MSCPAQSRKLLPYQPFTVALGVLAAPSAQAVTTAPVTPVMGSVSLCFSLPVGGSAALVWCL